MAWKIMAKIKACFSPIFDTLSDCSAIPALAIPIIKNKIPIPEEAIPKLLAYAGKIVIIVPRAIV